MASTDEIRTGLASILEEVADVKSDDVTDEKSFTDDLDVDSLSMVEVAMAAEEKFGVKIPDDELPKLKTVGDAVVLHPGQRRLIHRSTSRSTVTLQIEGRTSVNVSARPSVSGDDVVVTGLGATTPLGGDVATFWDGLLAGRSGVVALHQDWAADLSVRIAAPMALDPAEQMSRVQARRLDRSEQAAIVAARQAWADAGFTGRSRRMRPRSVACRRGGRHRDRRGDEPAERSTTSTSTRARRGFLR